MSRILNIIAESIAVKGTVASQDITISWIIPRLSVGKPRANPTPMTEPTRVCVVETGNPILEQIKTMVAAPKVAQKPREGVISVILLPIVSITRLPQTKSPKTIQAPPMARIHGRQGGRDVKSTILSGFVLSLLSYI